MMFRKHPYQPRLPGRHTAKVHIQAHRDEQQSQEAAQPSLVRSAFMIHKILLDSSKLILASWIQELAQKFFAQEPSSELARKIKDLGDDVFTLHEDIRDLLEPKTVYIPRWNTSRGMVMMKRFQQRFENLNQDKLALEAQDIQEISKSISKTLQLRF